MPHHRLCVLNEHGQFMGAVNLACIDDDAAKEHATVSTWPQVELWRLVARFKFGPSQRESALAP